MFLAVFSSMRYTVAGGTIMSTNNFAIRCVAA